MEFVRLGTTGLKVSKICLGTMTYGTPKWRDWVLDEEASEPFFQRAIEAGINFFDTADIYSLGVSEEVTGRALKKYAAGEREHLVVATKLCNPMGPSPNQRGLSRKHVMHAIDNSLKRLGLEYVDLYQIHRFDPTTPVEETIEALDDVVKAGKARYIGASSMYAWQFAEYLHKQNAMGKTRFVSMQDFYNLVYREEEREMLPLCAAHGIGVIPWSPLARGFLGRSAAQARDEQTTRAKSDHVFDLHHGEADYEILRRVEETAKTHGVTNAQIALSWVLHQPMVSAPTVGASRMKHLDDAIAALDIKLSAEEIAYLSAPYQTKPIIGHS